MKKFLIGLLCGVVFTVSTSVYATDSIQMLLFPAKFLFNEMPRDLKDEMPIVNYNGSVYVPIRFVTENLGAVVGYETNSKTIQIKNQPLHINDSADHSFKVGNLILVSAESNTKVIGQIDTGDYKGRVGVNLTFLNEQGNQIGFVDFGNINYSSGIHTFDTIGKGHFRKYSSVKMHINYPYSIEKAIHIGDIVNSMGVIKNAERFQLFLENIKNNQQDRIRITSYTVEGDPIFQDLKYNNGKIEFTYDNTQDLYGGIDKGRKSTICTKFVEKDTQQGAKYALTGCDSIVGEYFN